MVVRVAGAGDERRIAALRAEWTTENAGHPIDDEDFLSTFHRWFEQEKDQRVTWLAETDDGAVVGMLNMLVFTRMPKPAVDRSQWGYVANVFVLAPHRNDGIGGDLVDACTAYADEHEFVRLILSPSPRSVEFYERRGFSTDNPLMLRRGPS